MSETRERHALAGAEVVELTEALARIRGDRSQAEAKLRGVGRRRRLVVIAAVSGDGDAAGEMERLDAESGDLRREAERLDLAADVAHERLEGLGGVLAETATSPEQDGGR